jgi:hypothetical protein
MRTLLTGLLLIAIGGCTPSKNQDSPKKPAAPRLLHQTKAKAQIRKEFELFCFCTSPNHSTFRNP